MKIPTHVPNILRRSDVVKVLGLKSEQVGYLTRSGKIPTVGEQHRYQNGWFEYSPRDIAEFAADRQITPNWKALE